MLEPSSSEEEDDDIHPTKAPIKNGTVLGPGGHDAKRLDLPGGGTGPG